MRPSLRPLILSPPKDAVLRALKAAAGHLYVALCLAGYLLAVFYIEGMRK